MGLTSGWAWDSTQGKQPAAVRRVESAEFKPTHETNLVRGESAEWEMWQRLNTRMAVQDPNQLQKDEQAQRSLREMKKFSSVDLFQMDT